ncbi:MAG: peptide chain release factor 1 [Thaumarchaeota archaeon]|jgi:peptide chain release factor subunit 1|nr:peptide chain release factor 1 [Nitrososphaerota archaeon]
MGFSEVSPENPVLSEKTLATSVKEYISRRTLRELSEKRGRGTELISLYIPPGRRISEVMTNLREEYGKASNIKSRTTRKNVQDAIVKVQQRLKLYDEAPENGLVIFCGAIPGETPGSENIEIHVIEPPEKITLSYYGCDDKFYVEPLKEMLEKKDKYLILSIDNSEATIALASGRNIDVKDELTSGVPGKTSKGGQSARRFERLREMELNDFYRRVAERLNEIYLQNTDVKGLIVGGPGPTKEMFLEKDFIHYELRRKILAVVDTSYTGHQGIKEILGKASEKLQELDLIKERNLVGSFLKLVSTEPDKVVYGLKEVENAVQSGKVKLILFSEALDIFRVKIKCGKCDYAAVEQHPFQELIALPAKVSSTPCPKCGSTSLYVAEKESLLDRFIEIASQKNVQLELISTATEEGMMLQKGFGGVVGILK